MHYELIAEQNGTVMLIERYAGEVKYLELFENWFEFFTHVDLFHFRWGAVHLHSYLDIPFTD